MGVGEIAHMYVIPNARSVRRVIIGAEDFNVSALF